MSSPEKEIKIENSEKSQLKRQRVDSPEDLRHSITNNSPLNDEIGFKRSKTDAEVTEKNLAEIEVKNGQESHSLNLPYDNPGYNHEEKIQREEILETLTSQIFKSDIKNTFLNALWKLQIPINYFDSSFRKTEIFNARPGVPCELMIDFSEKLEEFTLMMRSGEGETLEKEFETDRILDGDNQGLFDKISIQSQGVIQEQEDFNENQGKHLINSTPTATQNTHPDFMQDFSPISTPFHNDHEMESLNATEITIKNINLINGSQSNDDEITKRKIEELKMSEKLKRDLQNKANPDLVFFNLKPRKESENYEKEISLENQITSNPVYNSNKISLEPLHNSLKNGHQNIPLLPAKSGNQLQDFDLEEWFNSKIDIQISNFKWESFTNTKVPQGERITHKFKFSRKLYPNKINEQETLIIMTDICVIKNNSKKTGYLGLVNEGMTCYMNSMLQTLNILGYFKSAVFKIPRITSEDSPTNCVAYSLQKIFFELMTESKPISTLGLVKSFGWGREQLLVQHDVQEFNLKLSDIMEAKMKDTEVEGTFKYLFEGRALNYIDCINVDYKSLKEEHFNDLQLTIKGCSDIYESFDKYTEEEILDKENMYEAEGHGKQIAKKGIKFLKLPNVLVLQLKRFEYNFRLDRMEKVNDYFEFYEKINLGKYIVEKKSNENETTNPNHQIEDNNYSLHSVMVHSGSANAGHYFAFIKPYINSNWIKFNDENVKFVDDFEVFSNNFGGASKVYKHFNRYEISEHEFKSDFNAYILVYIKDQERENILKQFNIQDVPIDFIKSFEHDKNEEKRMMLLNLRQSNNFNIPLFSKEILAGKNNLGILNPYNIEGGCSPLESIKNKMVLNLPKNLKIFEFINFISDISNIPRDRIQLYKYVYLYPLNILKKNIYKMIYIDEKFHEKSMLDILEIKPCKMYLLYIHINNQIEIKDMSGKNNINYSIFKQNELYDPSNRNNTGRNKRPLDEEEFIINEEKNQVIYFNKKENFWRFNQYNQDLNLHLNFFNQKDETKSPCENTVPLNSTESNKDIELIDDYCLCIIKFLVFDPKNTGCKFSILTDDIISIRKNSSLSSLRQKINFHEKYKQYLDNSLIDLIPDYNTTTVNFYVEFTTLEEINNNNNFSEIKKLEKKIFLSSNDNTVLNFKNDAACLIVNLKWKEKINFDSKEILELQPLIQEAIKEIHNTVSLPFIFIQDRRKDLAIDFLNGNKLKLKVDWNEQEIKEFLHKEILSNLDVLDEMLDLKGLQYYIFSRNGKLLEFTEYLQNNINLIELVQYGERDREHFTLSDNFPLFKYACKKATKMNSLFIPFYFNFIPRDFISNWQLINITLFDVYNNPIKKIGLIFSRKISKCNEILNFMIENNILQEFYNLKYEENKNSQDSQDVDESNYLNKNEVSQESEIINLNLESQNSNNENSENFSTISKNHNNRNRCRNTLPAESDEIFSLSQFLFLCYNSQTEIIYELFYNPYDVLKKHENDPRLTIDYRLQPFSENELRRYNDENKIFIAVINKERSICDPFMAFFDFCNTTIASMKLILVNKLKKIKKVTIYLEQLGLTPNDLNNPNRIKFFTSSLYNYKPIKNTFFNSDTDENVIANYMVSKQANNILIELPTLQTNTSNSNIILLNSA